MNRKYDLDYLQWLQKNARLYMAGLAALTLFIVVSWCLYFEPWQPGKNLAFWENESDQAVAEQQVPEDVKNSEEPEQIEEPPERSSAELQKQPETILPEEQNIREPDYKEAEPENLPEPALAGQILDAAELEKQLPVVTRPCDGEEVYRYGIGYDPIHDDYRFHDAACYQAKGCEVYAMADGIVQSADLNSQWQIVLQCGNYQIRYQGMHTLEIPPGTAVTGGQKLGTAGEYLTVQTMKS